MKTSNNNTTVDSQFKASKTCIDKARKLFKRQKTTVDLFDEECRDMQDKRTYVMIFRWDFLNDDYSNKSQLENEKIALTKNIYLMDTVRNFFVDIEKVDYYNLNHEKLGFTKMTWCVFFFLILIYGALLFLSISFVGPFGGLAVGMTLSALITVLILIISDCVDKRSYEKKIKTRALNLKKVSNDYNKKFLDNVAYQIEVSQYGGVIKLIKNNKFQRSIMKIIKDNTVKLKQKLPESRKKINIYEHNTMDKEIDIKKSTHDSSNTVIQNGKAIIENDNSQVDLHNESGMAMINVQDCGNQSILVGQVDDDEEPDFSEVREGNHMHAGNFDIRHNNQNNSQMVSSNEFTTKDNITNVQIQESCVVNEPKKASLEHTANFTIQESCIVNEPNKASLKHKAKVTIQESCVVDEKLKESLDQSSLPNTMRLDSRYINLSRLDPNH